MPPLRNVLQEWTIRHLDGEMPGYFANARVVVLGGRNHYRSTRVLSESTQNLRFADPAVEYGLDDIHSPFEVFERFRLRRGLAYPEIPLRGDVGGHRPGPEVHRVQGPRGPAGLRRRGGHLRRTRPVRVGRPEGKTLISTSIGEERLNACGAWE